jgi:hypothetical protein
MQLSAMDSQIVGVVVVGAIRGSWRLPLGGYQNNRQSKQAIYNRAWGILGFYNEQNKRQGHLFR